jgi:hypothetical protein
MEEGARALRTVWCFCSKASFRVDTDDRLLFRKGTSLPGVVWDTLEPQCVRVKDDPAKVIWDLEPFQHRYVHPLIWKEADWMLVVAVPRNPQQKHAASDWVVLVDSNIPLPNFDFSEQDCAAVASQITERAEILWRLEDAVRADGKKLDSEMSEKLDVA